jgi:hypothetical protein
MLPLLRYVSHFSYRPQGLSPRILTSALRRLKRFTPKPVQKLETPFLVHLSAVLSGIGGTPPQHHPPRVFHTVATIDVPRQPQHPFWLRAGLYPEDGIYASNISTAKVEVNAWGTSMEEAQELAILKLIKFLDECRMELRATLCPPLVIKAEWQLCSACPAEKMGRELFLYCRKFKLDMVLSNTQTWESLIPLIQSHSQVNPELRPLTDYYKVPPSLHLTRLGRRSYINELGGLMRREHHLIRRWMAEERASLIHFRGLLCGCWEMSRNMQGGSNFARQSCSNVVM